MQVQDLKNACPHWQDYVNHAFVQQLIQGSLPQAAFRYYLEQDYLFLLQYSRALGLAVYKSDNLADLRQSQQALHYLLNEEIELHIQYCAHFGISPQQLEQLPEDFATIAYSRYVLDCGQSGTLADLHTAIAPCILGYAEIGNNARHKSTGNNPYQSWIDMYASDSCQNAALATQTSLNRLLAKADSEKAQHIFNTAVRMEIAFWDMGLQAANPPLLHPHNPIHLAR